MKKYHWGPGLESLKHRNTCIRKKFEYKLTWCILTLVSYKWCHCVTLAEPGQDTTAVSTRPRLISQPDGESSGLE